MKLNTATLLQAAKWCEPIARNNGVLAIIKESFLLTCANGKCTLQSTDLSATISVTFPILSKDNFSCVLDRRVMKTIAGSETVEITQSIYDSSDKWKFGRPFLQIKTDTHINVRCEIIDPGDWPIFPTDYNLIFKSETFIKDFLRLKDYPTTDYMRPAMTGVGVNIVNGDLVLTASDGHKLKSITSKIENYAEDVLFNVVVNNQVFKSLDKFKQYKGVTSFKAIPSHCEIELAFGDYEISIVSRLVNQPYPDFMAVVNGCKKDASFTINKKDFLPKLIQCDQWTNRTTRQFFIDLERKVIIASDADYFNEFEVGVNIESETKGKFAFNAKFFIQLLKSITVDEITFEFETNKKPVIHDLNGEISLIMPVIIY